MCALVYACAYVYIYIYYIYVYTYTYVSVCIYVVFSFRATFIFHMFLEAHHNELYAKGPLPSGFQTSVDAACMWLSHFSTRA